MERKNEGSSEDSNQTDADESKTAAHLPCPPEALISVLDELEQKRQGHPPSKPSLH